VIESLVKFGAGTGFVNLSLKEIIMIIIAGILFYLAIKKNYEPLLLLPIGFGVLLANLPLTGLMDEGGLLYWLYQGVKLGIYPPLIFLGIGAMTDFGPQSPQPSFRSSCSVWYICDLYWLIISRFYHASGWSNWNNWWC